MKIERLNTLFEFIDGKLVNKISRGSAKKGALAGYIAEDGYRRVRVDGKYIYVHRIVWMLVNGEIPDDLKIDHIDGIRDHNEIKNLRLATDQENQYNKVRQKAGTSIYKGVWFDAAKSCWKATFRYPDKRQYLGQFSSELEAAKAYDAHAILVHGVFAKLNITESSNEAT
jgi:hypothetical protein